MKKLGGIDLERLFLEDSEWADKTDIPGVDMPTLIARHKGRYALCGLFLRPGMKFLDFPCGSGYASELLAPYGADYLGLEKYADVISHAKFHYGKYGTFSQGDLTEPQLRKEFFDVIACVEGVEHIELGAQVKLMKAFADALKPGGTLIVSCPQADKGGPNPLNQYHLHEHSRVSFWCLLGCDFRRLSTIEHSEILSTGKEQTMMFGIARE